MAESKNHCCGGGEGGGGDDGGGGGGGDGYCNHYDEECYQSYACYYCYGGLCYGLAMFYYEG